METKFMNMKNTKTKEPQKFFLNWSQILELKSSKFIYFLHIEKDKKTA